MTVHRGPLVYGVPHPERTWFCGFGWCNHYSWFAAWLHSIVRWWDGDDDE
jgi:hypothetical protein